MPAEPVPADPGREDDLAWLDRDPATAEEREAWLDRVCEFDQPPEPEEYEDFAPLTADELAEVRQAAGDDGFAGVSDAELIGVLCAWDRVEAHAAARKLAAAAELIRRNPRPGCEPEGPARMPETWDEYAADQLAHALAESRGRAGCLLDLAQTLQIRLPGTMAALLDGTITRFKAELITGATALLDPAEARAAEAKVLDRAARLTPGGLRAAIAGSPETGPACESPSTP